MWHWVMGMNRKNGVATTFGKFGHKLTMKLNHWTTEVILKEEK